MPEELLELDCVKGVDVGKEMAKTYLHTTGLCLLSDDVSVECV